LITGRPQPVTKSLSQYLEDSFYRKQQIQEVTYTGYYQQMFDKTDLSALLEFLLIKPWSKDSLNLVKLYIRYRELEVVGKLDKYFKTHDINRP